MSSRMYTEFAKEYEAAVSDNIYNSMYERPSLLTLLPALAGSAVLDLGCGPGMYADILVQNGASVTAVDASAQMVEITQAKIGSSHRCYQQDLALGLPRESTEQYDLVISPLTIHYLKTLLPLFKDIARVLKPDGSFVFSTHHPIVDFADSPAGQYYDRERITQQWNTLGRPETVSYYRRPLSDVTHAINESGFVIDRLTEGQVSPDLASRSPKYYERLTTRPTFLFYRCVKRR